MDDIVCGGCGIKNPDAAKFCMSCGTVLARACSNCRSDNTLDARFCIGCGHPLTAGVPSTLADRVLQSRHVLTGERKYVTVMFADTQGSTAALSGLDPEEVRDQLEPTVLAMVQAVRAHGGTVAKMLGDGLMALFGAPQAHEDHAVRACRAGLAILDSPVASHGSVSA